jgi:hypothetical protein
VSDGISKISHIFDRNKQFRTQNTQYFQRLNLELELELIQTQMAQKPMLRAEVGMRVRCANKASAG